MLQFLNFLFVFIADENLLRTLPNEVCSCSSLTILSVRGNKLSKIPVDIGRLTQLRVLNIVNNFLHNLPVTILNLTQLSALWISDNQSQPLMPLQKDFHKESQSYYLTCYLLPQMYTSNSTPTNAPSISTAPDSTYDYYAPPSTCDNSSHNMHMTALENLSLASVAKRKRNICFASDPPQEMAPNLRLMRSPTPYPKELRMMQAKFAANKMAHQAAHQATHHDATQPYMLNESDTMNFDQPNTKILNTMHIENQLNKQTLESNATINHKPSDHIHGISMMNNFDIDGGSISHHSNLSASAMDSTNSNLVQQQYMPLQTQQPVQNLEFNGSSRQMHYQSDSRMQTPIPAQTPTPLTNNYKDIVQYDSINSVPFRRNPTAAAQDTVDYNPNNTRDNLNHHQTQQQYQHRQPSIASANSESVSISIENDKKSAPNSTIQPYQSTPMETDFNRNGIYSDSPQVISNILRKL